MPYLLSISKNLGWIVIFASVISPAAAHNIQLAGDVAGTWHIEPNHSPKAGEKARAWVALTRKGGKILPLAEANCQMAVYSQPRKASDSPVLQPTVQAVNVEKYQGIPGADIVFPNTGLYQLELGCKPTVEGDFRGFQLKYDVTVAQGVTATTPKAKVSSQEKITSATQKEENGERNTFTLPLAIILGLGILGIAVWLMKKR